MVRGKVTIITISVLILMSVLLVPHVLSMADSTFVTNVSDSDGETYESGWNASSEELIPVIIQLNTDATVLDSSISARNTAFELAKQQVSSFSGAAELRAMSSGMSSDRVQIKRDLRIIDAISADVSPSILDGLLDSSAVKRIFPDEKVYALLDVSVPLINATKVWLLQDANGNPVTGKGVVVAVLDTGVDYTHPTLGGCKGSGCKVKGGYDFVNDDRDPMDNDGHGTMVAGIIAANGALKGVAPGVELLVYKVLEPSESGPASGDTSAVIAGIDAAIKDGADIICMSLGGELGVTDDALAFAVSRAVDAGVIVVAAAGNLGPYIGSIYSPASYENVIAVGSVGTDTMKKYNLKVVSENKTLDAYHMLHSPLVNISGELAYAELGYPENFSNSTFTGKIALVKRGGVSGDALYFHEKVKNAFDAGAIGVIIFNNRSGLFRGELADENEIPIGSSIPAFSLSQKDGLYLLDLMNNRTTVVVRLNQIQDVNYDTISFFSSLGPGPGYTIKPDIVAPGAGISSTAIDGGYDASHEGTSLAAPHVAGACALLLQLHPDWTPEMMKAALMNTAQDLGYCCFAQGAGRVDVSKAATVDFIALPSSISSTTDDYANSVITVQNLQNQSLQLNLSIIREETINFDFGPVKVTSPIHIDVTPTLTLSPGESKPINLSVSLPEVKSNVHFCGRIAINSTNSSIAVPFAFRRASQFVDNVSIQSVIGSASPGDTILVAAGDYRENVVINLPLHLRSLAGPSKTSVTASNPNEPVFNVYSNDVTISGFAITGGDIGITVEHSSSSTISNNIISKNNYGIQLRFSDSTLVKNNTLFNSSNNIVLTFSDKNWILWNAISNSENGIWLEFSDSNKFANNTVQENDVGIAVEIGSKDNIICNNNMLNNTRKQVSIRFSGSSNAFRGNYWSDYEGNDSNNDGIGDIPYHLTPYLSITGGVEDKEPYMQVDGWLKDD